jgi:hypothetical protein
MSGMHRLLEGCLLAALLLASPVVSADQASDRERERERGDRRYEDSGYSGGNDRYDSRDCIDGRDDHYRGRECENAWVNDRYNTPQYIGQPSRRHPGGTTDRYGTPDYIGQPNRGSAYDGVGSGHHEIERGHASSRQMRSGGGWR